MPQSYLPRQNERSLVLAIVQMLNYLPDTFAWRQETSGLPVRTKTGWQVKSNVFERGKPDIAGSKNGKSFVMEVNIANSK